MTIDLSAVDFIVLSTRSGNAVAAFMLPSDAAAYIAWRTAQEGPHGGAYEIINADGTQLVAQPRPKASMLTWADGKRFVAVQL